MAIDTPVSFRSLVIYEVFTRNHGPNGTFADVEADLPRMKTLGVDVVWFMPIHPIGVVERKGSMGSSYAIANYREVNPEYGTKADFTHLIETAHGLGLKIMIDVVYNHTSPDSNLVAEHPDWYNQDETGKPITSVPDWSDIIDLKYPNPALEDYLIESLLGWVRLGVDGFRCDVGSIIPVSFWLEARRRVAEIKPGFIWLSESVHANFIDDRRRRGLRAQSDSEIFQAFDICYDYEIWPVWQAAVLGHVPASRYLEMVRFQHCIYPVNFVKMHCVENHDNARVMGIAPTKAQGLAWTAFTAFNNGPFMLYTGQENAPTHAPDQFEIDRVDWGSYELQPFLTVLAKLKKDPAQTSGIFTVAAAEPAIVAGWESGQGCLLGIFNVTAAAGEVAVPVPDGRYTDLLTGSEVVVSNGKAAIPSAASIIRYTQPANLRWFHSPLFDTHFPRL